MREVIKHATMDLSIFPPALAEVVALHAAMFGGTRMEADGSAGDSTTTGGQEAGQDDKNHTFQPPATQEDLDRIITARLSRERAKYADYDQLKEQAGKWSAAEEAQKTETQKLTERAERAERELAAAQAQALRAEVAAAKKLPPELAARLQGATRAELEADADKLAALLTPQPPESRRYDPIPGQGTARQDANAHGFESGAQRARNKIKTI